MRLRRNEILLVVELTKYKSLPSSEARKRHIDYLSDAGAKNNVVMAGRFADEKGALIIWRVSSMEEARSLADEDPYFLDKWITYELREWPAIFDYTVNPPKLP